MNRLVIVGNGFDLAHGLPTKYSDFINDYWRTVCETNGTEKIKYKDDLVDLHCEFGMLINDAEILAIGNINNFQDIVQFVNRNNNNRDGVFEITFFNQFFKIISDMLTENWVDIENVYYDILKSISKGNYRKYNYPWGISQLNTEFEQVKNLLEKYLNKIDKIQDANNSILKYFKLINENVEDYFLEFPKQDREELEKFQNNYNVNREEGINIITYCLNFNYTQTIDNYIKITKEFKNDRNYGEVINLQIHGRLNDNNNRINFGFGDEMDDDYKAIENLDNNEYLKNFKSFQYLQNLNYKTLLDFIDSNKFQVVIIGHSCGLSDRTLLNTIFEHNNCRSIKVFYYEEKDKDGKVIKDNYTEIIQNISRHFNKKKLMREKIVNKILCKPLPQIQLPLK